ncbi:histidine phosphatase family protein, partial [Listeria ivanovii]
MKKNILKAMVMFCALLLIAGCGNDSTTSKADTTEKKDGTVTFYVVRHGKTMLNT